jgi:nicotinate-nucleotide--dimethylbenzimidazole phosphoribosyltransferase
MKNWFEEACASPDEKSLSIAEKRQTQLTKPPGSLGRLEQLAVLFAAWQGTELPLLSKIGIRVFAADHGITKQGVSAFPAEVTVQMIGNFVTGGGAISVLAKELDADFAVVNMGTFSSVADAPGLHQKPLMPGTDDFSLGPAMPMAVVVQALTAGRDEIESLDCELFVGGEMGIGNTTSAAAIVSAIADQPAEKTVGRGTGIDDEAWIKKVTIVASALEKHRQSLDDPLTLLSAIGGLEIAALCGAYIKCAQRGIPILLDGFITTAAALVACQVNPGVQGWLIASHLSVEQGHSIALQHLGLEALLALNLRLGEGSGAAVAVPLIQSALTLHCNMATFTEAGVAAASAAESES